MTITFDEAVARVSAVVSERPDFIYKTKETGDHAYTCVYFEGDGTPSCLIGVAFAEELNEVDVIDGHNDDGIDKIIDNGLLSATDKAKDFLSSVQCNQDAGSSWSISLRAALEGVDEDDYDENEAA